MSSEMTETPFDVPGGWSMRMVDLAGRRFELLLPADPDRVLETQIEIEQQDVADQQAADPYWAALWSSASPTAEAVLAADWTPRQAVLELGCGIGVVGLAALARGLCVTFSDHVAQAIDLALVNARRNGFHEARGVALDWHHPSLASSDERYSIILASDVLYNRANHLPLLNTIDRFLAPGGVCWIGDPGRFNSREFLPVACDKFHVTLRDREGATFAVPVSGQFQIFVLQRADEV